MKPSLPFRLAVLAVALGAATTTARAHCDTLDGPVVQAARAALARGDVTPVLKWIPAADEAALRAAFAHTVEVRQLSPAAAALADRYFFETLVRIHRAGEGVPYTGLQPAGRADHALAAADRAIEQGAVGPLADDLAARLRDTLRASFEELRERQAHMSDSVEAGRRYVEAYVKFIHLYERLASEATPDPAKPADHHH